MTTLAQPWREVQAGELSRVRGVCLDIDDTLSTKGKLTDRAFSALWDLKRAGFAVVPVTGRPAGWCDHIARFWPVDAVVGENGAFTFYMDRSASGAVLRRIDTPSDIPLASAKARLKELGEKIRKRFPHARWASDQAYREYDLAIDICEDVPTWPKGAVDALLELCAAEGAHAKLSSIHVNTWYGNYDKKTGLSHWLKQGSPGLDSSFRASFPGGAPQWEELLFIGDSPNDEPLFASFDYSVGVANLKLYLDRLRHPPRWLTDSESGDGFAEMAGKLIAARRG